MGYYYKSFKYRPEEPDVLYSVGAKAFGRPYNEAKFSLEGFNVDRTGIGYFVSDEQKLAKRRGEWLNVQDEKGSIRDAAQYAKDFVDTEQGWEWGVWKVEATPYSIEQLKDMYAQGLLGEGPLIGKLVNELRIIERVI